MSPAELIRAASWWTGKEPVFGVCPGVDEHGRIHSLKQLRLTGVGRQDLLDYFDNSWTLTEVLFSSLVSQDAFMRPPYHGLRHPLIFYFAHPAVLYVNKLRVAGLLTAPVNEHFERIFEVGVDEMSWDDMSKNEMQWPDLQAVVDYRKTVYSVIKNLILEDQRCDPSHIPITTKSAAWALVMGFEHERIHFETSAVLIRELPIALVSRPIQWPQQWPKQWPEQQSEQLPTAPEGGKEKLMTFAARSVEIGKPSHIPTFGWDNEYGSRIVEVPAFTAGTHLITNQDFAAFVADGGYTDEALWSSEGWRWRTFRNTKAPTFWVPQGPAGLRQYRLRTTFEVVDWQPEWPVIVNYHEAKAYCAWKSRYESGEPPYRLLTEAEHHVLREQCADDTRWNLNALSGSETSAYAFGDNGLYDVFGNVWQWCEDEFNPLPGFKSHPYYEDFSTPCFDGKHQMIMGGSYISTGAEAEPYARFQFRPHFFQNAGFRLVRDLIDGARPRKTTAVKINQLRSGSDYESDELLAQYLLLHFAQGNEVFAFPDLPSQLLHFPQRCAEVLRLAASQHQVPMNRVLDLGCAVGGSAFALSEHYREVVGIDLSKQFITAATELQERGFATFLRKDQGELHTRIEVKRPSGAHPERIRFSEGDACALSPELKGFDAVLMANLLCRLPDPAACLKSLVSQNTLRPGGLLALVSPYSWLEQHTRKHSWLGARYHDGIHQTSQEAITELLGPDFVLLDHRPMPLMIREHERKYQYIVSDLMLWQRRGPQGVSR